MIKQPKAGELRHYITISDWQDVPAIDSGIDQQLTNPIELWAKIEPVGSAVYQGSVQVRETITHRIYIRFRIGVTTDKMITYKRVKYRIRRVSDLAFLGLFLVIEAEALDAYA